MSDMYSIACFFPWLPRNYDYVFGFLAVFKISPGQLVSVRLEHNNLMIFSVASPEVFNRLQHLYCRVLFFPIAGRNALECFAYPLIPAYNFVTFSTMTAKFIAENLNRLLAKLGRVLYHRYICRMPRLKSDFRSKTVGVVFLGEATGQPHRGYGQQVQTAGVAVPYVLAARPMSGGPAFFIPTGGPAVALQQPLPAPGYLQQQGTVLQPPVYLHQFQGQQANAFGCTAACPYYQYYKQHCAGCVYGNKSPPIGVSTPPQKPTEEKRGDECPSDYTTSEDEYSESFTDEGQQD